MIFVSIIYASCDQSSSVLHKFRVNQIQSIHQSWTYSLGLAHNHVF
jgi:hypothetical protein